MGSLKNNFDEKVPFQPMFVDNSQNEAHWRSLVFGPYYRFVQAALVVPHCNDPEHQNSARTKVCKIFGLGFFLVGLLPLLARTFFLFKNLGHTTLFSLNWAINFFLAMLSMHSIFSLITLFILIKSDFFNEFVRKFLATIKNKIAPGVPFLKSHIILGLFMCFFLYTYIFFCYENVVDYDHFVEDKVNSSATFRNSMFGSSNLFFIDSVIIVWSAFVSSLAVVVYNLVATSLATEYQKFNEELKEASKNGHLSHVDLLNNYASRQLDFMDLAHFAFSKFGLLVTFSFIAGLVTHGLSGFIMRSFAETIPAFAKISTISFMILGIVLLLADVKRVSDFAKSVDETKNILLFERSIHTQIDEKLIQVANNVVFRISNSHYLPTVFSSFKVNEKFFQRAFLIFPFLIEYLNAQKVLVD
ncbi:hypothetical protein FO519_003800 [Halicephalobus sp. NKZ332]|nr:hypothetical protein FO519_003800 [Halicephalobus sp. NKZ332]